MDKLKQPGAIFGDTGMATNPRYHNGNYRRKMRLRFKSINAQCGICHGKYGEIRYDQKSCSKNPLSFCIDEIHPVSRWREFGYESPEAACMDINNLQAAHWACNAAKSNKINPIRGDGKIKINHSDGSW